MVDEYLGLAPEHFVLHAGNPRHHLQMFTTLGFV
jgi:trimethylamine:corrinoid methyltransferase-like protein